MASSSTFVFFVVFALVVAGAHASLLPLPAQMTTGAGTAYLTPGYTYYCATGGVCNNTLQQALARYVALIPPASAKNIKTAPLGATELSECSVYVKSADESLTIDTDESYTLQVDAGDCYLSAETVYGAMHGLETLTQLYVGRTIPNVSLTITDAPRFRFRGILIDTSRHFLPVSFIEHILDTMAANKLNVLHWHIVDSESFPAGSTLFPQLAQTGAWAPSAIYSPSDMAGLVEYARLRGIRVMPEFDVPGHGDWWGIPSLMGCVDVLDPTQNATYDFLLEFLGEMGAIFPDADMFLGGDEVEYTCWDQNANISAWLKAHGMTSAQLQQYFWQQMSTLVLPKLNKTIGVWEADSIQVDPKNLPVGSFLNVYQSQSTLNTTTAMGYPSVLSGTWYLDQENPDNCHEYAWQMVWQCFYAVEPLLPGMTDEQKALVLGGMVAMWGEGVNDKNFDSRTWDRTAAVAERLWSPEGTSEVLNNTANRLADHICRLDSRGVRASPVQPNFCPDDEVVSAVHTSSSNMAVLTVDREAVLLEENARLRAKLAAHGIDPDSA